ncbi:MAG: hypothetical protein DRO05_05910, partial [Thermoproteota archaeon]
GERLGEKLPLRLISSFLFQILTLVLIFISVTFEIWKLNHSLLFGSGTGFALCLSLNLGLSSHSKEPPKKIPMVLVIVSLVTLSLFFIWLGGVPLFDTNLREKANLSIVRAFCYMTFVYGFCALVSSKKQERVLVFIATLGSFLFSLLGFRFEPMGILLILIMAFWYRGLLNLQTTIFVSILLVVIVVIVGYVKVPPEWILDPLETLFYRAGFALNTLDKILEMAYPFGLTRGSASFSPPRSREIVGQVIYGYNQSITSTLIGAPALDFGLIGIALVMIYFGMMLGVGYSMLKKYQCWCSMIGYLLAASHSLLLIESGVDFTMWIFTLFIWHLYSRYGRILRYDKT